MITNLIIRALIAALTSLLTLIPNVSLPSDLSVTDIIDYANNFGRVMPLTFMAQCVTATFAIHLAFWAWDGAVWLFHQIHGSD